MKRRTKGNSGAEAEMPGQRGASVEVIYCGCVGSFIPRVFASQDGVTNVGCCALMAMLMRVHDICGALLFPPTQGTWSFRHDGFSRAERSRTTMVKQCCLCNGVPLPGTMAVNLPFTNALSSLFVPLCNPLPAVCCQGGRMTAPPVRVRVRVVVSPAAAPVDALPAEKRSSTTFHWGGTR